MIVALLAFGAGMVAHHLLVKRAEALAEQQSKPAEVVGFIPAN